MNPNQTQDLKILPAIVHAVGAIAAFHLAYHWQAMALMIVFYLLALASLLRLRTGRQAFYFGLFVGFGVYAPPLEFFWTIFGEAAIALWLVLAFWHGLFLVMARQCRVRFGWNAAVLLLPFLWTGIEYFRSEVYHLKFTWLSAGFAFADSTLYSPFRWLGVYGVGFLMMTLVSGMMLAQCRRMLLGCAFVSAIAGILIFAPASDSAKADNERTVRVAGVQIEFPDEAELIGALDRLIEEEPLAELIVLSEYTFAGGVPDEIKEWCRTNERHLIGGGMDQMENGDAYNTAFVVGTNGEIVFKQAKSVPIQFFQDGKAARERRVWESPWGRLGIGICYDLSYRNVMDDFVEQGAEALIVPTMDVQDWGQEQHELHARVAPMRSMEYGIPIMRLASSGISQLTTPGGEVTATAPFPGQHRVIAGDLQLNGGGVLPVDRIIAPFACVLTIGLLLFLMFEPVIRKVRALIPVRTERRSTALADSCPPVCAT